MPAADSLSDHVRAIADKLTREGQWLATAESCTGGWIAKTLTDLPGSSAWFAGGIVSYSNAAKHRLLGVSPETLAHHGAVSEETVQEMARGALRCFDATHAVAVSGVAGPEGGTEAKPVGTVWIAWADPSGVRARLFDFPGDREAVRMHAVRAALAGICPA